MIRTRSARRVLRVLALVRHRRSFEVVERGNYEAIYGNMPAFGLAKATEHVRAVGGGETARMGLMRGENEPGVPSPE